MSGILQLRPSAYHLIIIMLEIREKILHFDEVWYGAAWCVDDWAIKLRLGCTHTHGGQGYLNAGMIHVTEIKTKAQIRAIVIPSLHVSKCIHRHKFGQRKKSASPKLIKVKQTKSMSRREPSQGYHFHTFHSFTKSNI